MLPKVFFPRSNSATWSSQAVTSHLADTATPLRVSASHYDPMLTFHVLRGPFGQSLQVP